MKLKFKMVMKYINYVIRHKYFVFVAGMRLGVPLWRLLVHDFSKLSRHEFMQYARKYSYEGEWPTQAKIHGEGGGLFHKHTQQSVDRDFDYSWLNHIHKNKHHWQHWILRNDDESVVVLDMPMTYVLEMVADWQGAGRAIKGHWDDLPDWLAQNFPTLIMSDLTRVRTTSVLKWLELSPSSFCDQEQYEAWLRYKGSWRWHHDGMGDLKWPR